MFHLLKTILVRGCTRRRRSLALALLGGGIVLAGCGQKGDLYLPAGTEAVGRASLPQTLIPGRTRGPASASSTSSTASPAPAPAPAPGASVPATTPTEPRQ